MTAPQGEPGLDPTPTAPTTTPAPGVPAPAPQPTTTPGLDPNAPIDFDNLPPNVKAYVTHLRNEAGGHRQGKTAEAQARAAAEQRAQEAQELADAQAEKVWGSTVKLEIFQRAADLGADPKALLADDTFIDSLEDLADDDPTTAKFCDALEARIAKAVKADPKLAAQRGGPTRQGADITGSGGGGTGRPTSIAAALRKQFGG